MRSLGLFWGTMYDRGNRYGQNQGGASYRSTTRATGRKSSLGTLHGSALHREQAR